MWESNFLFFLWGVEMKRNKVSWFSVSVDSVKKMRFLQKFLGVLVFVLLALFLGTVWGVF